MLSFISDADKILYICRNSQLILWLILVLHKEVCLRKNRISNLPKRGSGIFL
jgi:hypothetical protein